MNEEELKILEELGLDPSTHVIENGRVIRIPAETLSSSDASSSDSNLSLLADDASLSDVPSEIETFGTGAARSVVPTVIGAGTAGGITALAPLLVTNPAGWAVGGAALLGGLGTALYSRYKQDQLIPPSERELLGNQENPKSAFAGELVGQLGVAKPSLKNLKSVYQGTKALVGRGTTPTALQKANMFNTGLGAGLGSGIELGSQLVSEDEISPGRVIASGLGGAFINEPNKVGRFLGMKPTPVDSVRGPRPIIADETPSTSEPLLLGQGTRQNDFEVSQRGTVGKPGEVGDETVNVFFDRLEARLKDAPSVKPIVPPESFVPGVEQTPIVPEQIIDPITSKAITYEQKAREILLNKAMTGEEVGRNVQDDLTTSMAKRVFGDTPDNAQLIAEFGDTARDPRTKKFVSSKTRVVNDPELLAPPTEIELIQQDFDNVRFSRPSNAQQKLVAKLMQDTGIKSNIRAQSTLRDVVERLSGEHEITVYDTSGKPLPKNAAGVAYLRERFAAINPDSKNYGADTPLHEVAHIFVEDMKRKGNKFEKDLIEQGIKAYGSEEALVNNIGLTTLDQTLAPNSGGFLKDFWTHIKARFGQASDEDIKSLLSNKLLKDPALNKRIFADDSSSVMILDERGLRDAGLPLENNMDLSDRNSVIIGNNQPYGLLNTPTFSEGGIKTYSDGSRDFVVDYVNKADARLLRENIKLAADSGVDGFGIYNNPDLMLQLKAAAKQLGLDDLKIGISQDGNYYRVELTPQILKQLADDGNVVYQNRSELAGGNLPDAGISPKQPQVWSQRSSFVPWFEGMVSRVRSNVNAELADAFDRRAWRQQRLTGKYVNQHIHDFMKMGVDKSSMDRAYQYRYNRYHGLQQNIALNELEQQIVQKLDSVYPVIRQDQERAGLMIAYTVRGERKYRAAKGVNPEYQGSIIDKKVARILREEPMNPLRDQYIQEIADFWYSQNDSARNPHYSREAALKEAKEYARALGGDRQLDDVSKFNALRREKGMGLPWSVVEKDGMKAFTRYGERAAKDLANFIELEKPVNIRSMLNWPDQFGKKDSNNQDVGHISHAKEVQDVLTYISRDLPQTDAALMAVNRAITSMFMGLMTGTRDIFSSYSQMLPYMSLDDQLKFPAAIAKLSEGIRDSYQFGVNRDNVLDLEFRGSSMDKTMDMAHSVSNFMSEMQGRNLLEKTSRGITFNMGRLLAESNFGKAIGGDIQAYEWLKMFGKGIDEPIDNVMARSALSDDQINEMAAAFTERVQGTYDERNLPAWAQTGLLSPFFSLSRWGIEKSNIIKQDIVNPVLQGKPGAIGKLLLYTGGSLMTGEVISLVSEYLTGVRQQSATIRETMKSEFATEDDQIAALLTAAQNAGFAGIVGDVAKSMMDASMGNQPRGYNFPLYEWVSDSLIGNLQDATVAIQQGMNPFDVTVKLVNAMAKDSVQGYRMVLNHVDSEAAQRKNMVRDLRIFRQQTRGNSLNPQISAGEIANSDIQEFKRTTDLVKAKQLLPKILNRLKEQYKNMPEELQRRVDSLDQISSSEYPSTRNESGEFGQYLKFLKETLSPEDYKKSIEYIKRKENATAVKKSML